MLHELGEFEAGRRLGADWPALRASLASRRADLYVRALRDHLADCLVTLPTLLQRRADASLHFWFANLEGVRALLFPRLATGLCRLVRGRPGRGVARRGVGRRGALGPRLRRSCWRSIARRATRRLRRIERCVQSPDWVLG